MPFLPFHMIILIACSEHKLFGPGNSDDRDDPETYYLNESKAYKEPYSDICRSLVVEGRPSLVQENLFTSFTSNLSNNVLVSLAHCWRNLTLVSNVCEAVPRSLFCAQNRINVLREVRFEFPFRPIMVHTQILVHRWDPVHRFVPLVAEATLQHEHYSIRVLLTMGLHVQTVNM